MAAAHTERRALQRRLLQTLAARLRARNPIVDQLMRDRGSSGLDWDEILGPPIEPLTGLLTALHDLDLGLETCVLVLDRADITTDAREWNFLTQIGAVPHVAVIDRLDDLIKRFQRSRFVADDLMKVATKAVEELRENHLPLIGLRNQIAHSVQGHHAAFSRIPERTRTWDVFALYSLDRDLAEGQELPTEEERSEVLSEMRDRLKEVTNVAETLCKLLAHVEWSR